MTKLPIFQEFFAKTWFDCNLCVIINTFHIYRAVKNFKMSCQLSLFADIHELSSILKHVLPEIQPDVLSAVKGALYSVTSSVFRML